MLKKVIVGGGTSNLPLSGLIRWFERRFPWRRIRDKTKDIPTHSWAAGYSEDLGCVIVLESSWYGYRPSEWSIWLKSHRIIDAYHNTKKDMTTAVKWAGKQLGRNYDYRAFVTFLFKYLVYYFSLKWVHHPFETPKSLHCSEAKTRFVQQEGYLQGIQAEGVFPLEFSQRIDEITDFEDVTDKVKSGEWWAEFFNEDKEEAA
jgi:hypothetical protein